LTSAQVSFFNTALKIAFQMLSIDALLLQIAILAEICIKMRYFHRKITKNYLEVSPSRPPLPSAAGGSAPRSPIPHCPIKNSWQRHCSCTPFF